MEPSRTESSRRVREHWLAILLLAAGLAGLAFAAAGDRVSDRLHEDERDYVTAAIHLSRHGVFATAPPTARSPEPGAYREPAYPVLIAVAWRLAGIVPPTDPEAIARLPAEARAWYPVRALNTLLLAIAALSVALSVARLSGWSAGALAAALAACSPALQANVALAMAENLTAAEVALAGLCLLGLARRAPGARLATLVVVGLAPLARAEGLLLLPAALVVDACAGRGRPAKARLRAGALLAFGLALPSALWVARNAWFLGAPVLADRSGLALAVRAELDADIARFGVPSALLAWTPLEAAQRRSKRLAPAATWLEFRPLGPGNYYFRTLRRWQEERRRAAADSLAVDAAFRRSALRSFVTHPLDHARGALAVAWRGLFAERSPGWTRPFDASLALGLLLGAALLLVTARALRHASLPALALFAPAWTLFAFHVGATELLPRYAEPLLPLAWAAVALVVGFVFSGRLEAPGAPVPDRRLST